MRTPRIRNTAVLIGYDPEGRCVYSDILDVHDDYDGEHVWDHPTSVQRLKLRRLKGYLFDPQGLLDQEFENIYDLSTGTSESGTSRFADGTEQDR